MMVNSRVIQPENHSGHPEKMPITRDRNAVGTTVGFKDHREFVR
jgi:hypothetical protein